MRLAEMQGRVREVEEELEEALSDAEAAKDARDEAEEALRLEREVRGSESLAKRDLRMRSR